MVTLSSDDLSPENEVPCVRQISNYIISSSLLQALRNKALCVETRAGTQELNKYVLLITF
jgi:hypothetical protein